MQIAMEQRLGLRQELLAEDCNFKMKPPLAPERDCFISDRFVEVIRIGIAVRIVEDEVFRYFAQLRIREATGASFFSC